MEHNQVLKEIKSVPIKGYLQAVSQNGEILVYRSEELYHVYYFDGENFVESQFSLEIDAGEVKDAFHEEATPHYPIQTRLINHTIVVYVQGDGGYLVAEIRLGDYGRQEPIIKYMVFYEGVIDMDMHPTQDCLIVADPSSIQVCFLPQPGQDTVWTLPVQNSTSITSGKLFLQAEAESISYYMFYMQTVPSTELQIFKIEETKFNEKYYINNYNTFYIRSANPHDQFTALDHQPQHNLFSISNDFISQEKETRSNLDYFMSGELDLVKEEGEGRLFHSFVPGGKQLITGDFIYYFNSVRREHLKKVCIVPYTYNNGTIILDHQEESCREGHFDRVGSWQNGESTYTLTHVDRKLNIYQHLEQDPIAEFNADAFTTSSNNRLIVESCGQLAYYQWGHEEEIHVIHPGLKPHPSTITPPIVGMGIIISILVLLLIGVFLWGWRRKGPVVAVKDLTEKCDGSTIQNCSGQEKTLEPQ